jgi:hypothetical protein
MNADRHYVIASRATLWGLPIRRQEFVNALGRVIRQAGFLLRRRQKAQNSSAGFRSGNTAYRSLDISLQ